MRLSEDHRLQIIEWYSGDVQLNARGLSGDRWAFLCPPNAVSVQAWFSGRLYRVIPARQALVVVQRSAELPTGL
jgi:hypothetical protein